MIRINKMLVLAPHPDDELIGCGALLKQLADFGLPIKVVVVTDGAAGLPQGADPAVRAAESRAGLLQLGLRDCEFWNFRDGNLPLGGPIADRYRSVVASFEPSHILLPHPAESHTDHRMLTRGLLMALESQWSGGLWFYETTTPCQPVNHFEDATATLEHKLAALGSHASQMAEFDYIRHCRLLAEMRGMVLGKQAAEAFLTYDWDGSPEQFFASEPLVSIVVRASDASLASHALESLAQQTYPWIEIVLVWFGDGSVPDTSALGLPVVVVPGTDNRSANLNAGTRAASGEYVGFLDEDDIFYVGHVSVLVAELVARPDVDIAFSGCRVVNCRRQPDGAIVELGEVERFDHPYEAGRLAFGNYITLHSTLARRSVARVIPFEPELEAYEDWDFFAHAEQRGVQFARVDGIGCEYRLYPQPGEEANVAAVHARKGYTKWRDIVRRRICGRFAPSDLDRIGEYADRHKAPLAEAGAKRDELALAQAQAQTELQEYREAVAWVRALMETDAELPATVGASVKRLIGARLAGPVVSILLPTFDTEPHLLKAMLQSIVSQTYPRWQLCLVDDASTQPGMLQVLDEFERERAGDDRVIIRRRSDNGGIVPASNDALALARGEFVAFVDHDDVLAEDALLHVAMAARRQPGVKLIYTDSRMVDYAGNVLNVLNKPDWSPNTLLSYNYINHLTLVRRDLLERLGGLRPEYAGSQDWDLLLRLREELRDEEVTHLREVLYDWRAATTSVAYSPSNKPWALDAARRVAADTVAKCAGAEVTVQANSRGIGYLVDWNGRQRPVTAVIPTHSNRDGLRLCLKGLLEGTDYPSLQLLIIANRCEDPEMRADLAALAGRPDITVMDDPSPFNWSALMNGAMARMQTEAVLFLNDDVEILDRDWLRRMQRYLDLPGIGAVGAMLYYPDGGLQHGGIETDPGWIAGEIKRSLAPQEAAWIKDVSAVTGACLLTTRAAVAKAGGLDEGLPSHYGDVDFCLALRKAGYRVVQPMDVRLRHHESVTRGRVERPNDPEWNQAIVRTRQKWNDFLQERYRVVFQMASRSRVIGMTP